MTDGFDSSDGPVAAPLPADEPERLAALRSYAILDTEPEEQFDRLTRLATQLTGTPIALVSLIDEARQWFKSRVGLDVQQTSRDLAFCAHAILDQKVFVVEDASRDARFRGNPLVTGSPDIRFYAGAPLTTRDGHTLGTLCIIDRVPRQPDKSVLDLLRNLASVVVDELELRRALAEVERQRKALEDANRAKDVLLAGVSHDLRTPLNAVIGFSDLMRQETFGPHGHPKYLEYATLIHASGQHLKDMVDQVLDLARLQAKGMPLSLAPQDLGATVDQILRMLDTIAAEARVTMAAELPSGLAPVLADAVALRQILLNLIGNAVKYTPPGGRVRVTGRAGAGDRVEIIVADTGAGIAPEHLDRLGEDFFRAGQGGGQTPGLGLGLSIVRRLVAAHGGSIHFDSRVGQGTTVTVALPAAAVG